MPTKEAATKLRKPIISTEVENVPIEVLHPHPKNSRQGNVGAIMQSIEANGFFGAILAQRGSNTILAGYHRWEAAKQLGYKVVPVMFVAVDDDRALRIVLADNKTSDEASYDTAGLVKTLSELVEETRDLDGTGYSEEELQDLIDDLEPETQHAEFDAKKTYTVIVDCKNGAEQARVFKKLTQLKLKVRIED